MISYSISEPDVGKEENVKIAKTFLYVLNGQAPILILLEYTVCLDLASPERHISIAQKDEGVSPAKARCPSCKNDIFLEHGAASLKQHYM